MSTKKEFQTGSAHGEFRQGDPHPTNESLWFWRYRKDREDWMDAGTYAKRRKQVRECTKKHSPNSNIEILAKTCPNCGVEFETRRTQKKYCSAECRPVFSLTGISAGVLEWNEEAERYGNE